MCRQCFAAGSFEVFREHELLMAMQALKLEDESMAALNNLTRFLHIAGTKMMR